MNTQYSIVNIGKIIAGIGSIEQIATVVQDIQATRVIILTDKGVLGAGIVDVPKKILENLGVVVTVIDSVPPEPSLEQVESICKIVNALQAQMIIGIGGGSVIDTAKLAALLAVNQVDLNDVIAGKSLFTQRGLPTLMIPTTAGTGAEATPNAIVLLSEQAVKVGIVTEKMLPDYVILDPNVTVNLPPHITAQTGMDALCHAIECYISKKANPLSDTLAIKSITLLTRSIEKAYKNGKDLAAREDMLLGSMYGGMSIASSSTVAVHALSYPLGGKYRIAHGLSNSILLPYVMEFNMDACAHRLKDIALAMGIKSEGSDLYQAQKVVQALYSLIDNLNIKCDLREKGIDEAALTEMVESASKVTRLLNNNPKPLSKDDIHNIYKKLLEKECYDR